jgi:hypothetical protein
MGFWRHQVFITEPKCLSSSLSVSECVNSSQLTILLLFISNTAMTFTANSLPFFFLPLAIWMLETFSFSPNKDHHMPKKLKAFINSVIELGL